MALWTRAAVVLMLKNSVPGNCTAAASQALSCGSQPARRARMRWCCVTSSTAVVPGLCAWTSWQYDAVVKKTDPTTYVTPSTQPPVAARYAGTEPSTKHADPAMKSHAMVAFRRSGRTVIRLARSRQRLDRSTIDRSPSLRVIPSG